MNERTQTLLIVGAALAGAYVLASAVNSASQASNQGITQGISNAGSEIGEGVSHLIFDGGIIAIVGVILIFI